MDAEEAVKKINKFNKKLALAIAALVAGVVMLISGIVVLVITLNHGSDMHDAEVLVATGSWQREDEPGVIWNFTETGKGSLTTNAHTDDYDFIWAIEGDKLKIETEWLYTLNDEFDYKIDNNRLILNDEIVFVPAN
jgi:hypothetical protein